MISPPVEVTVKPMAVRVTADFRSQNEKALAQIAAESLLINTELRNPISLL